MVKKYINVRAITQVNAKKSELEQYLEESQFPYEVKDVLSFDIFHWWAKVFNSYKDGS